MAIAINDQGIVFPDDTVQKGAVVSGMIFLWYGDSANVPAGWNICDGTNGTPDLSEKFVICAGSTYAVGTTGGTKDATVYQHTHTGSVSTDPDHNHSLSPTSHSHPAVTISPGGSHTHSSTSNHEVSFGTGGSHSHPGYGITIGNSPSHSHPWSVGDGGAHSHPFATSPSTFNLHNHQARYNDLISPAVTAGDQTPTPYTNVYNGWLRNVSDWPSPSPGFPADRPVINTGSGGSHAHTTTATPTVPSHVHPVTFNTGGPHSHTGTLSVSPAPEHNHTIQITSISTNTGHQHPAPGITINPFSGSTSNQSTSHAHTFAELSAAGDVDPINKNLPPYFALYYIMKL